MFVHRCISCICSSALQVYEHDLITLPSVSDVLAQLWAVAAGVARWAISQSPAVVWLAIRGVMSFASEAMHWTALLTDATLPPHALLSSVSFAWTFYACNVVLGRSRIDEVLRLKVLVVPVCSLYLAAHVLSEYLLATSIALAVWTVTAVLFDLRHERARQHARAEVMQHRLQSTAPVPVTDVLPPETIPARVFAADECVICSDAMGDAGLTYTMPCGHVHHRACLQQWCVSSGRDLCPICRQSCTASAAQVALHTVF